MDNRPWTMDVKSKTYRSCHGQWTMGYGRKK